MIRAILISPVSLLQQADQMIANVQGGAAQVFGEQRWQDGTGEQYAVAAGLFAEDVFQLAARSGAPFRVCETGDVCEAAPSGIILALSNNPLSTLKLAGLTPVDTGEA